MLGYLVNVVCAKICHLHIKGCVCVCVCGGGGGSERVMLLAKADRSHYHYTQALKTRQRIIHTPGTKIMLYDV